MTTLYVKDFSTTPGARYRNLGKASGEEFRDDILIPKLREDNNLIVNLDGVRGYGTSFLDEAFAGLIRNNSFDVNIVRGLIERIETANLGWKTEIQVYVEDAIAKKEEGE